MKHQIDLRGLSCPQPVLKTKKLFDDPSVEAVEALVDDEVCVNNLQRLAKSLKAHCSVKTKSDAYQICIERKGSAASSAKADSEAGSPSTQSASAMPSAKDQKRMTVIFLAKDTFGEGDVDFSRNLINMFLQTVLDAGHQPAAILLANTGVKLLAPDSASLKVLRDFKEKGCEVLACGLCVEFYGLKEHIAKEQITNMYAISEYLFAADKILSP